MKYALGRLAVLLPGRAPQGARGLKFRRALQVGAGKHVAPRKGRVG